MQETRVAIYARVSTEEQAESGYSIDAQLDVLRRHCELYGSKIAGEYVDRGVSGKSIKGRYELQRLLKDAEQGRFNEVIVWKFNRMARKNIDLLHIVDVLERNNIAFRSFSEHFDTSSPTGRFALQMMGAVGELERSTIIDNVKMGMRQRAKTGRHNGKVPLGYKILHVPDATRDESTQVVIVENEAALIRTIYELYSSGKGLKAVANTLNQQGHRTKLGNPFSTCAIAAILDNPFYMGQIRYSRYENWSERRRKGLSKNVIVVKGHHPPLVSKELWDKVQLLRKKKSSLPKRNFEGSYLLTGILRCPECGAAMSTSRTVNKLKDGSKVTRHYYSCGRFKSQGSAICHANSIRKEEAEQTVLERIQTMLSKPELLKKIVRKVNDRKLNRTKPLQSELSGAHERIRELSEKKRRYMDMYELEEMDRNLFSNRLAKISQQLDQEQARASQFELELQGDHAEPVPYELVRSLIERFDHLLQHSPYQQRKTLMHLVIKQITLNDKRQVQDVELIFNQETDKHFLSLAPSAHTSAEGAFSFNEKAPLLKYQLTIKI